MTWFQTLEQGAAATLDADQKERIRAAAYLESTTDHELAEIVVEELRRAVEDSPLAQAAFARLDELKVADIVCSIDTFEIPTPCCGHRVAVRSRGRLIGAGSPGDEIEEHTSAVCAFCQRTFEITVVSVARSEQSVSREISFSVVPETFTYHVSGTHRGAGYSGQSFWRPRADGSPVKPRRTRIEV